jgi:hypothetical protein
MRLLLLAAGFGDGCGNPLALEAHAPEHAGITAAANVVPTGGSTSNVATETCSCK